MRDFKWDKLKNIGQLKQERNLTCSIPGCGKKLTHLQGPGSQSFCRDHQLALVEYGGTGKADRPHTFHRKWICDECGKNIPEAVKKKFSNLEENDPDLFNRLCRKRIIGDHIIRKADGGPDTAENIQTLCLDCDADKTIMNEDYRKGSCQNT